MTAEPLISAISGWGGTWAPRGWALCSGQLLAISQFDAVFSLIGTIYGGDGRTTFRLPDLRARAPIGAGQSPGTSHYPEGALLGSEFQTLTQLNLPVHNHGIEVTLGVSIPASDQAGTTDTPAPTLAPAKYSRRGDAPVLGYGASDGTTQLHAGEILGGMAVGNAGGNQSFEIVQPVQAIQHIFCLYGVYPSRN